MSMRRLVVPLTLIALATGGLPVLAQDGSPAPSAAPTAPDPSVAPGSAVSPAPAASSSPAGPGPLVGRTRWADVRDPDVRRSGVIGHVVTLGNEAIAFAPTADANGQTAVRVLATGDGATWTRRGRIRLTGAVEDVIVDGTSLLAVGWDEGAAIWRSTDAGRTWALPADQTPFAAGADGGPGLPEDAEVLAIARGPRGLVAVGTASDQDGTFRRGAAWRSDDGEAWERLNGAAGQPPFVALAGDAATYVAVTADRGSQDASTGLQWSADGSGWTPATIDLVAGEAIHGVRSIPGGFLAWGAPRGDGGPSTWSSVDGRSWSRQASDPALARADIATTESVEGGALTIAVGGRPTGAFGFPRLGEAWRRDRIRPAWGPACVTDVTSVRAILVAVGGTCRASTPRGRAWTSPLEP